MRLKFLGVLAGMALLAGCGNAQQSLPVQDLVVTEADGTQHTVKVEVARTPEERETGLMYRKSLCADCGMVFVWDKPEQVAMWMKNTLIPLDMIFANGGQVVGVAAHAKPEDLTPLQPVAESDMVVEVNGGWTDGKQLLKVELK